MPALENPRDEIFAREYVATSGNATAAYQKASPTCRSPNSAGVKGHKRLQDPAVQARIEEIKGELVNRSNMTLDRILQRIDEDRQAAFDDGQWQTALAADVSLAKLLGFWIEKKDVRGQIGVNVFERCTSIDQLFEAVGKALGGEEASALVLALKHVLRRGTEGVGDVIDGTAKRIEHQADE
jgi:phage terminase small subunit